MEGERQVEENQHFAISFRITGAETIEILGTDTPPMKGTTKMQIGRPTNGVVESQGQSVGIVPHKALDVAGFGQNSGDSDVNAYSGNNSD